MIILVGLFTLQSGITYSQPEIVGGRNYVKKGTEWFIEKNGKEIAMRPGAIIVRFKDILPDSTLSEPGRCC